MLFNGDWVISTAFVCVIVSHKHALLAIDVADASQNVARGNSLIMSCKLANLEERWTTVKHTIDSIQRRKFALSRHFLLLFSRDELSLFNEMVKLLIKAHHLLVVIMMIFWVHIVVFAKHFHKVKSISREMSVVKARLE